MSASEPGQEYTLAHTWGCSIDEITIDKDPSGMCDNEPFWSEVDNLFQIFCQLCSIDGKDSN